MIIVGCTSKPEAGDAKEFKNFFQKFLYVPAPDYASRLMLWHHFIRERLEQVSPPRRRRGLEFRRHLSHTHTPCRLGACIWSSVRAERQEASLLVCHICVVSTTISAVVETKS